jgi:hypothetical protein
VMRRAGVPGECVLGAGAAHRAGRCHGLSSACYMTHDVTYREWLWADTLELGGDWVTRHEHEKDESRTWGLHAGYQQPLENRVAL